MKRIKETSLLLLYTLMVLIQAVSLNKYFITFSPLLIFILIIIIYWKNIVSFNFNEIKKKELWNELSSFLTITILLQAASNMVAKYLLGISPVDNSKFLLAATPIITVICSSVQEEVIFRKIIYSLIKSKSNFWIGAILSSSLFAMCHFNISGWLGYFIVGLIWCHVYEKTKNIMITILLHAILNTIAFIAISLPFYLI